jgi:hypothetical protein
MANKLTIARVKALARTIEAPVAVSAGRPITAADHGKVLAIASALTVTLPQDTLPPGFRCWFVAPASGNLSVDPLGTVTLNGAGTTLTRARAANPVTVELYVPAANTALIGGA